jgi:hypothetical protein
LAANKGFITLTLAEWTPTANTKHAGRLAEKTQFAWQPHSFLAIPDESENRNELGMSITSLKI